MAVQIIQRLLSDLSGEEAQVTARFGLDGKEYTVDLTESENEELRTFLSRYVQAGVRAGKSRRQTADMVQILSPQRLPKQPVQSSTKADRKRELDDIRVWAREKGIAISGFGRIPQNIVDMYHNRNALEAAAIAEAAEAVNAQNRRDTLDVVNGKVPVKVNGAKVTVPAGSEKKPAKANGKAVPAATFSDPEAAEPPRKAAPRKRAAAKATAGAR